MIPHVNTRGKYSFPPVRFGGNIGRNSESLTAITTDRGPGDPAQTRPGGSKFTIPFNFVNYVFREKGKNTLELKKNTRVFVLSVWKKDLLPA